MTSRGSRSERRRLGAYYTPPALVDLLVREVLLPWCETSATPPFVIDPACGDGRLLEAAGWAITERYGIDPAPFLIGVELDDTTAAETERRLGCRVLRGDAREVLGAPEYSHAFDVVIGNPPYLSQLSTGTARGGSSRLGGGPYADVAAEFLALAPRLVRSPGGRIGLVLPMSVLATRDVAPIREAVEREARIDLCWWADESMFDANVRTCILGFVAGDSPAPNGVRRFHGPDARPIDPVRHEGSATASWGWLVADVVGIPPLAIGSGHGLLRDIAIATADFRDQYYGLVGAVGDDVDGPPLVTSGLIDVAECRWGTRTTRFAKVRYAAPRVDVSRLGSALQAWARTRLVPKVLVASQTKVIEAVVDERGEWLPSVPVISVVPYDAADVWLAAAMLTSPVASAWIALQRIGTGLSAQAIRVTASDLAALPLPSDRTAWKDASDALRNGDVYGCGRHMIRAYGLNHRADLYDWWEQRVNGSRGRSD